MPDRRTRDRRRDLPPADTVESGHVYALSEAPGVGQQAHRVTVEVAQALQADRPLPVDISPETYCAHSGPCGR